MAKGSASVDEIHFNIAATCCFLLCVIGLIVGIVIGANSLNDESSIEWIKTTCDVSGVADTTRDCAGTCKRTYNNAAGSACSVCDGQWVDKTAAVYVKSESFTGSKVADKCGTKGLCRRECVLSYAATLDAKVNKTSACWFADGENVRLGNCDDEKGKFQKVIIILSVLLAIVCVAYFGCFGMMYCGKREGWVSSRSKDPEFKNME